MRSVRERGLRRALVVTASAGLQDLHQQAAGLISGVEIWSEDMGEVDRLRARLFGREDRKTLNFNIFPGSDPASPEEVAREVNRALDQIEAGDFDLADIDDPPHTGRQKSTVLTYGFVGLP